MSHQPRPEAGERRRRAIPKDNEVNVCGARTSWMLSCFFFFSSRRRHTRLQGDWSSDVCSSDLPTDFASRKVTPCAIVISVRPLGLAAAFTKALKGSGISTDSTQHTGYEHPTLDRKSVV